MPRYQFFVGSREAVREGGVVNTDSFTDALEAIGEQMDLHDGDTLEIGVQGFPPARFEYVMTLEPGLIGPWRPMRLAA